MAIKCHPSLLVEIERVVAEARSGQHGGKPFLDGLHYGLSIAGLTDDPKVRENWARGEGRAARRKRFRE
jgi:hypothetical protein